MDKFPEAFARLEQRVDVNQIETFRQLVLVFASFAGEKWRGTRKQVDALANEARRIGIPLNGVRERRAIRYPISPVRTWIAEAVKIRGRTYARYRDRSTGRFIKKPC
jgi:hypothetical protein